jgi:hypothetical protein
MYTEQYYWIYFQYYLWTRLCKRNIQPVYHCTEKSLFLPYSVLRNGDSQSIGYGNSLEVWTYVHSCTEDYNCILLLQYYSTVHYYTCTLTVQSLVLLYFWDDLLYGVKPVCKGDNSTLETRGCEEAGDKRLFCPDRDLYNRTGQDRNLYTG